MIKNKNKQNYFELLGLPVTESMYGDYLWMQTEFVNEKLYLQSNY